MQCCAINFGDLILVERMMKSRKELTGFCPTAALATFLSGLMAAILCVAPVAAQAPSLAMLDRLDSGRWELRFRDGSPTRSICVRSGRELLQIRHSNTGCSRYIVEDGPDVVTVQYTCPGNGYGLTTVRRETKTLAQIKGSGLVDSRAFEFAAEARRTGSCR